MLNHVQKGVIAQDVPFHKERFNCAFQQYNLNRNMRFQIRQCRYLNNSVEQGHRFIKRRVRPMLGLKSFAPRRAIFAEIELWRMLKKDQN